ncbi:regulatory protein RecX [Crenothrix sp.]|uniref:regulatory protein RecX n=1 Tax=Crenothrix sp. TaxID=3100433 RepID=UPI00374CF5BB
MPNPVDNQYAEIKAACLRLLTRREHSQQELLSKLVLKGYSKEHSLPVIEALSQQDWQNDQRYAESYVRNCIRRGYGPIYIKQGLRQQDVNDVDVEGIIQESVGSWMAQIEQVYVKKYGQKPIVGRNDQAKRNRFLLQRGFSQAMISALLNHP